MVHFWVSGDGILELIHVESCSGDANGLSIWIESSCELTVRMCIRIRISSECLPRKAFKVYL